MIGTVTIPLITRLALGAAIPAASLGISELVCRYVQTLWETQAVERARALNEISHEFAVLHNLSEETRSPVQVESWTDALDFSLCFSPDRRAFWCAKQGQCSSGTTEECRSLTDRASAIIEGRSDPHGLIKQVTRVVFAVMGLFATGAMYALLSPTAHFFGRRVLPDLIYRMDILRTVKAVFAGVCLGAVPSLVPPFGRHFSAR